jgi:AhpD family alkylhydroperoxidase
MAFIQTIPPKKATGELAAAYRTFGDRFGADMIAKIIQAVSLRPTSVARAARAFELSQWYGEGSRVHRELVAATISRLNECHYCTDGHEAFMQAAGGDATLAADLLAGKTSGATPLEREIVGLCTKSCHGAASLCPADLAPLKSMVEDSALDYLLCIGAYHYVNRIADLLHVDPEVLPRPLRRVEPLRRLITGLASRMMRKSMDLSTKLYTDRYEHALAALTPIFEDQHGHGPGEALGVFRARPKILEDLMIDLQERRESTLVRPIMAKVCAVVSAALPRSVDDVSSIHPRPKDPVEAFAFVGTRYAHRATADMVAALRQTGLDDLGILDLTVAIAASNKWERVCRLAGVPVERVWPAAR